jgi:hypothetical protein
LACATIISTIAARTIVDTIIAATDPVDASNWRRVA